MTEPYYSDDSVTLYHGDCLDVLRELPATSVDAVITDPPYDLTAGKKGGTGAASLNPNSPAGRSRISTGGGFMGKEWDATGIAFQPEVWVECLRVLKPGGHLMSFGGSRTWHRLAAAVEDSGFEIRDSIAWLYGSGFPKSLDVSKAIDKAAGAERAVIGQGQYASRKPRPYEGGTALHISEKDDRVGHPLTAPATAEAAHWQGWGTALKPAFEPIVVGRKPFTGTVAANVLEHGTGALSIDACRTGVPEDKRAAGTKTYQRFDTGSESKGVQPAPHDGLGRWPTNVVLDESQADALDLQTGVLTSGYMRPETDRSTRQGDAYGQFAARTATETNGDSGGASRFFPTFRYEAKAPTSERPRDGDTAHPTVKPLDLMRWLVRLVTPPGGVVLEPFAGSGTTAEACVIEGFRCIAIEREADYLPLIINRLSKPIQIGLDFGGVA